MAQAMNKKMVLLSSAFTPEHAAERTFTKKLIEAN
jgi:hypothetical protein